MVKKIVILGGSFLQADFISSAITRGLEVFVVDADKDCYVSQWKSLTFSHLDFSDEVKLRSFCIEKEVDFIYAPCNEIGNLVSARLSKDFGYIYNSTEVVQITLDKSRQREIAKRCNLLHSPTYHVIDSMQSYANIPIKYPAVVKPISSSAGRGVTGVKNYAELENAIDIACEFNGYKNQIIIEEFLDGEQISIETISAMGKHYIVGITLEIIGSEPLFIERCHYMNINIHNLYCYRLNNVVQELLNLIGIKYGPCHIEMKVSGNTISLIEIASRAGGLRNRLMSLAGYPDYNDLILDAYLNHDINEMKIYPPSMHSLVNILLHPEDLRSVVLGKKDSCLQSLYLGNKGPVYDPKNLIDAYGYAFFCGNESLKAYSLEGY